jgi:hypothetical protein
MTDQSIIEDAKTAGFIIEGNSIFAENGHTVLNGKLAYLIQLREARQSSQSEPVAISVPTAPKKIWLCIGDTDFDEVEREGWKWNDLAEVTWSTDRIDQCDIPYIRADLAAPQQAIPSERIIGYITPSDLEFPLAYPIIGYQADWRNIPVYVHASPTAPIESDK